MIVPSRLEFLTQESPGPLVLSLPLPEATPYDLYRRIVLPGRPSFLLESGQRAAPIGRYSFFGSDPYLVLSGKAPCYELTTREGTVVRDGDPYVALTELLRASRLPKPNGFPPFWGGPWASSATIPFAVRILSQLRPSHLGLPDMQFVFVELLAAIDHSTRTLHLIFSPPLDRFLGESREKLYREGCDRSAEFEARLSAHPRFEDPSSAEQIQVTPNRSPIPTWSRC